MDFLRNVYQLTEGEYYYDLPMGLEDIHYTVQYRCISLDSNHNYAVFRDVDEGGSTYYFFQDKLDQDNSQQKSFNIVLKNTYEQYLRTLDKEVKLKEGHYYYDMKSSPCKSPTLYKCIGVTKENNVFILQNIEYNCIYLFYEGCYTRDIYYGLDWDFREVLESEIVNFQAGKTYFDKLSAKFFICVGEANNQVILEHLPDPEDDVDDALGIYILEKSNPFTDLEHKKTFRFQESITKRGTVGTW